MIYGMLQCQRLLRHHRRLKIEMGCERFEGLVLGWWLFGATPELARAELEGKGKEASRLHEGRQPRNKSYIMQYLCVITYI